MGLLYRWGSGRYAPITTEMSAKSEHTGWYALKVFYRRTAAIEKTLNEAGCETYIPRVMVEKIEGGVKYAATPYVSSLLFVRCTESFLVDFKKAHDTDFLYYIDLATKRPGRIRDAEFDNFKKRTEREKSGIAEYAKASVIKTLLPILDNIERSNSADSESPDYIKGIELIIKQFGELANNLGIEEVGAAGEKFDPNYHDAVMHIEDEQFGENEIAEVLQKGYKLGDTVIRPAMVKVAN